MYIKLIQPKMINRPMDTGMKIRMSPPLGLYTIVNMLKTENTVVVENENIQDINYHDDPDIVGITVTVDAMPRAIEIAKKFKGMGIPVVAGGIHVTTAFDTIPDDCFDALCVGAAESTWYDIVNDVQQGKLKKIYIDQGNYKIISPDYTAIQSSQYLFSNIIHTSRGCPFKCDFCYNSSQSRRYVKRPITDVIDEIVLMNSKHIMFIDDNFIGDIDWIKAFLKELKPLKLKWNAAVTVNIINHLDVLDLMQQSGCQSLFIGFESINSNSVKSVNKNHNERKKYEILIDEIHKRNMMINASMVFGIDGDDSSVFDKTLEWVVQNKIETVTTHILTPYPGTKLYQKMKAENRIITDDLSLYNTAHVVFKPLNMTQNELYEGYIKFYKDVYSFKNIMKRIPISKNQVLPYLAFNLFYRKFGKFTNFFCKVFTYKRIGYWGEKMSKYF